MGINDSVSWEDSQKNKKDLLIYSLACGIPPSEASIVVRGNGFVGSVFADT